MKKCSMQWVSRPEVSVLGLVLGLVLDQVLGLGLVLVRDLVLGQVLGLVVDQVLGLGLVLSSGVAARTTSMR
jgi:hypothetical protein